jgi:hypothetical protein
MDIRRLILTAGFVVMAAGAVLAVIREEPGSGVIAFFGTLALVAGAIALLFRTRLPGAQRYSSDPFASEVQSTDVINFARLRVAGLGGLGLVVVCLGIAIALPRIGQTMALAAIGGALVAFGVIRRRRERGPLDSSHAQPGARSVLVEPDETPREAESLEPPDASRQRRAVVPSA